MAEPSPSQPGSNGIVGRVRGASVSLINANTQLGMWQATGTAIAHAPNLTELRDAQSGGNNIAFSAQGHSARIAVQAPDGDLALVKPATRRATFPTLAPKEPGVQAAAVEQVPESTEPATERGAGLGEVEEVDVDVESHMDNKPKHHDHHHHFHAHLHRRRSLYEKHKSEHKEDWRATVGHALKAFWRFVLTPAGFVITIYCLNIVAWGAMLFFLLLKAAPAMNNPTADDDYSPRKIWLEISSQILNALFCVTGFGLAPWRFRDLVWFIQAVHFKNPTAIHRLVQQNQGWFRPPAWAEEDASETSSSSTARPPTFTGVKAPPTPLWKLGFTIWMMVLNTLLQAVLCYFMWGYNRLDRPSWATGTFIGLGCGVAMLAGLMSWWEGRKVKKIEGPQVKVVEEAV